MPKKKLTYSGVGVDVDIEAKAAKILYQASKKTWINRQGKLGEVTLPFDDFSGLRYVQVDKLPKGTVIYGGSDGVATKADFAERIDRYDTLGFDLMAMVCDDAVVRGGEPVLVKNVLSVNSLGRDESRLPFIYDLANGLAKASNLANVALINGEIAQHNDRMSARKFSLDLSGDVTWFASKDRLITGFKIKPGDYIVGLSEPNLRCNGISLIRRILQKKFGNNWEQRKIKGKRLIDMAIAPSVIYAKAIVDMFGGWNLVRPSKVDLHGVAHISGGGIPEKLGRVLRPSGFGAEIDNPFEAPELMLLCQEWGGISDKEAHRTWHMGQGMIIISPNPEKVIKVAKDHAIKAEVIGQITEKPGIRIKSQGIDGAYLSF